MKLKVKLLKWRAGFPAVMINEKTAESLSIHTQDRISIRTRKKEIMTIVDVIGSVLKKNEIAVSSEIRKRLSLSKGQNVDVNFAPPPRSLEYIKAKLYKKHISQKQMDSIIKDVVNNYLSEAEIALFISATSSSSFTFRETIFLINSILKTGNKLNLKNKFIVDKHSIGGIPGRITPIVVSICAATGLIMPKTSSRAITSPAGTVDAMETITKVEFSAKKVKSIIKKVGACIVWGGALGLVPADGKIIQVEKMLKIDPKSQLLASIMSKKLAVGSNYILIHIPYGKSAKVNKSKALVLKKDFERLGKHFKKKLKCILTKNEGPIGNGVGPALEMIDVIKVLRREDPCYKLEEMAIYLSGELLEMTGKAKKGKGAEIAREILDSKKALKKFGQIIKAQDGKIIKLKPAKLKKEIKAQKNYKILEIDNKKINSLARVAGCPLDKFAGLYLHAHEKDKVKKGEKIITIYSESKSRLNQAVKFFHKEKPIKMGK